MPTCRERTGSPPTRRIKELYPATRVVGISGADETTHGAMLAAGADGCVMKGRTARAEIVEALRATSDE